MSDLNFIIVDQLFNVFFRSEVKMAQNNSYFTAKECRAVIKYLILKGHLANKMYNMSVTLHEKRPSYCTVKNWVSGFRTGHFSTEDKECFGRPTQVTIPENVEAIHCNTLDNKKKFTERYPEKE
jgi:hypothetical protein